MRRTTRAGGNFAKPSVGSLAPTRIGSFRSIISVPASASILNTCALVYVGGRSRRQACPYRPRCRVIPIIRKDLRANRTLQLCDRSRSKFRGKTLGSRKDFGVSHDICYFSAAHAKCSVTMARRTRVEYPGALYHAISRGNQRQKIFKDDRDRTKYLELLSRLKELHSFRIHAYVLMPNHVHLLVESGRVPLSRIMQRLGSGYTQYFNRRHGLVGHLFQGRYKAILCDKDNYLLELSRYLLLLPVRIQALQDPIDYIWSSYRGYVRRPERQKWLDTTAVLRQFSRN